MSCFVVSAATAAITTVATKIIEKKEKNSEIQMDTKIKFSRKLKWLNTMLWGGSALLAFEHIWHGEFVPWFPFLTNITDSASRSEMFYEMATVGVIMTIFVVAFWGCIVFVSSVLERKVLKLDTVKREV